jgi:hypothetical protein
MPDLPRSNASYARRHLRFGWWSLLVFAALGLLLETFHGFKFGAYLDVANDTRRLMWRLAHAHGALIGVVHILFGLVLRGAGDTGFRNSPRTSIALVSAGVLLPGGFFLGGFGFFGGDPGLGILLVPVGAILLLVALGSIAREVGREPGPSEKRPRR